MGYLWMELWGLYKIALYIGLFGFLFTPVIKSATKNTKFKHVTWSHDGFQEELPFLGTSYFEVAC